jgi:putative sugar O-methyltransferase
MLFRFLDAAGRHRDAPMLPLGLSVGRLDLIAWRIAELFGQANGAKPLAQLSASLAGNPLDAFEVDGQWYTHALLNYYWRYAHACRFIEFDRVDSVVELGSGGGKQVEVLRKLHPHLTFYLLDLAPQLYVCGQYLKRVFPGQVVDYRVTRTASPVPAGQPGQILTLGNWQIRDLAPRGATLFWNDSSLSEMEPDVVLHYLGAVAPKVQSAFLCQCMEGKQVGRAGEFGVMQPTVFDHYVRGLGAEFELVDRSPAWQPLGRITDAGGYEDVIWRRVGR